MSDHIRNSKPNGSPVATGTKILVVNKSGRTSERVTIRLLLLVVVVFNICDTIFIIIFVFIIRAPELLCIW